LTGQDPIPRAVAVVIDGSRALLIKRYLRRDAPSGCAQCREVDWTGDRCIGHHYAVLPGGHVEEGETIRQAAERELWEETTLSGTAGEQVFQGSHQGRPAHYFIMTGVSGRPELSGEEAIENSADNSFELLWSTADRFDELNLRPAEIRPMLAALLAGD
jgi:8-oxo-dGTP diphosphatase